jgi:hypothetical protein
MELLWSAFERAGPSGEDMPDDRDTSQAALSGSASVTTRRFFGDVDNG